MRQATARQAARRVACRDHGGNYQLQVHFHLLDTFMVYDSLSLAQSSGDIVPAAPATMRAIDGPAVN